MQCGKGVYLGKFVEKLLAVGCWLLASSLHITTVLIYHQKQKPKANS